MRIRKQVYELTSEDLRECPIWEFASDEEGEPGQDEATVRPKHELKVIRDRSCADLLCAAEFHLADGTVLQGYVYARDESDPGAVQPVIVTRGGQVMFWLGAFAPKIDAIARAYANLGRTREAIFPIRFRSIVEVEGGRIEGTIPAFLYLEDDLTTVRQVL